VFLGFVAVLVCSAAVSSYGIVRLQRIGSGLSLRARAYMPLTSAISTLEAVHKEQERSPDRLLAETDPRLRANLIVDRTYFARGVGEGVQSAQQLVASAPQTMPERETLDKIAVRLSAAAAQIAKEDKAAAVVTSQAAPSSDDVAALKTAERRVDRELK